MSDNYQLRRTIEEKAAKDPGYAIAYALMRVADAQENVAVHLKYLGNGNASTPMGAIEAFGKHIGEKLDIIGDSLNRSAETVMVAEAIEAFGKDLTEALGLISDQMETANKRS